MQHDTIAKGEVIRQYTSSDGRNSTTYEPILPKKKKKVEPASSETSTTNSQVTRSPGGQRNMLHHTTGLQPEKPGL